MISGPADLRARVAWRASASPAKLEMHRLRAMRRSWLNGIENSSCPAVFRAQARVIRRWMRPLRRQLRKERR